MRSSRSFWRQQRSGQCGPEKDAFRSLWRDYQASNVSPDSAERKVTGETSCAGFSPKHWIDSGPAILAQASACSASSSNCPAASPLLDEIPKHAESRTDSPLTRKGSQNTSTRKRSARSTALETPQLGKTSKNSSLPGRPIRS